MFSQDVIEHLNLERDAHERWFDNNELMQELILNPHMIIQPTLMGNVRHVYACDTDYGRIMSIELYAHKWSYLLSLVEKYTAVDLIEDLMFQIDGLEGRCRVENDFLALELPTGYILNIVYDDLVRFEVQPINDMFHDEPF